MTFAGTPTTNDPSGITMPSRQTAPAPMMDQLPTSTLFNSMAPMPMRQSSWTVAPWMMARWPTATRAPIVQGTPWSRWTMEPSWMLESSPTVMLSVSPRRTAVGQMLTRGPRVTSPMTWAALWTKAVGWMVGGFMGLGQRADRTQVLRLRLQVTGVQGVWRSDAIAPDTCAPPDTRTP